MVCPSLKNSGVSPGAAQQHNYAPIVFNSYTNRLHSCLLQNTLSDVWHLHLLNPEMHLYSILSDIELVSLSYIVHIANIYLVITQVPEFYRLNISGDLEHRIEQMNTRYPQSQILPGSIVRQKEESKYSIRTTLNGLNLNKTGVSSPYNLHDCTVLV